jgi:hypothetical protein
MCHVNVILLCREGLGALLCQTPLMYQEIRQGEFVYIRTLLIIHLRLVDV